MRDRIRPRTMSNAAWKQKSITRIAASPISVGTLRLGRTRS